MQNMARYMDARIQGREEERQNTEKEKKRADDAEAKLLALQKELEELKKKQNS